MRPEDEHQEFVDRKRETRMARIDAMPEDVRALVHDYGLTIVQACLDLGLRKPAHIKHIVETVLNEMSPTRGTFSAQGIRAPLKEGS